MKDAFAPGPLDESMSPLGPIFDIALKDITGQICGTAEFSGWHRGQCVRVSGTVFPSSFLVLLFL